jgi:molybdate transport system ATP-binding protein
MLKVSVQTRRGSFALEAQFDAPVPGVVALFGRSGSGKSTLINVIAGLLQPAAGSISLNGRVLLDTVQHIQVPAEQRRVGYVFQDARLFPHLSVAANLSYGLRRSRATRFISLDEVASLLGLGPLMQRRTHRLSGGERQRVAIGRALLSQPQLLLLDEPLASLDASRREEVLPYLESLRDQLSIPMVYVSHDFDEVWRLATQLVLMADGRALAQGSVADMSLHPELRAIVGADAVGSIVDGLALGVASDSGLMRVQVGSGELKVEGLGGATGKSLRVQLLARDIIVATEKPEHLSVRNALKGIVAQVNGDSDGSDMIFIDIGGAIIMSRITKAATRDLKLVPGKTVWALVKSVSLRRHVLERRPLLGAGPQMQNGHNVVIGP